MTRFTAIKKHSSGQEKAYRCTARAHAHTLSTEYHLQHKQPQNLDLHWLNSEVLYSRLYFPPQAHGYKLGLCTWKTI